MSDLWKWLRTICGWIELSWDERVELSVSWAERELSWADWAELSWADWAERELSWADWAERIELSGLSWAWAELSWAELSGLSWAWVELSELTFFLSWHKSGCRNRTHQPERWHTKTGTFHATQYSDPQCQHMETKLLFVRTTDNKLLIHNVF